MTTIAFQVDEFQSIIKKQDGSILRSNARPPMSFDYEVLTFTTQEKTRFWAGERHELTDEQITEVEAYVNSIEVDADLSSTMARIHQSKKILAATDWYVIRFLETGKAVPDHITDMRTKARDIINEAEKEL
jgi:hypothetical protein